MKKIGIYLLFLLSKTWRIKILGVIDNQPKVIAFWHGMMLPVWFYFRKQENKTAIISKSKDGEILSKYLKLLKYNLIRGSSSSGGKGVIEQASKSAKESIVLITPDGPRGPNRVMKVGAVKIAYNAGVPLQLCNVKISKSIKLNNWDKFQIPLPFSSITLSFSEIIIIDSMEDREEVKKSMKEFEKLMSEGN